MNSPVGAVISVLGSAVSLAGAFLARGARGAFGLTSVSIKLDDNETVHPFALRAVLWQHVLHRMAKNFTWFLNLELSDW